MTRSQNVKIGCTGTKQSADAVASSGEMSLQNFTIQRAIGRGSYGKVSIVQKKNTKKLFAMKYMNKLACIKSHSVDNVLRELEILQNVSHTFIVNLWFTFHDYDTIYMVVDLLLGGDLRFHLQKGVKFSTYQVRLYICEVGAALEYLKGRNILHRDVKPDNLLLDETGHVHLTDFNIATVITKDHRCTSICGTRPYMAPEMYRLAIDGSYGYSFEVDWWSLGIFAYELLAHKRPYKINSDMPMSEICELISSRSVNYNYISDEKTVKLIKHLLSIDPQHRLSTLDGLRKSNEVNLDIDSVVARKVKPDFIPRQDHLNCDPTYELEEMILEAEPLHKKKSGKHSIPDSDDPISLQLRNITNRFRPYNRDREAIPTAVTAATNTNLSSTNANTTANATTTTATAT